MTSGLEEVFDADATHVWTGRAPDAAAPPDTGVLSPDELRRMRALPPGPAAAYAHTHIAVHRILGRYLSRPPGSVVLGRAVCPGCGSTGHGPPVVRTPATRLTFNLSRSETHWLLAVAADRRVGADIQHELPDARPDLASMAAVCFAAAELAGFPPPGHGENADARSAYFYRAWTRKEAVAKALGVGLAADLTAIAIAPGATGPVQVRAAAGPGQAGTLWQVRDVPMAGRVFAAVAHEAAATGPVRLLTMAPGCPGESLDIPGEDRRGLPVARTGHRDR
ncbi:4'-phosphopantetheinyl transferase superfamily protein [Streptomyces sp. NPDC051020]|uniref:4'-phosphopantetheinyl transferase family protein n=1 Tax=Streptomyces sp. NPDC051020 TaxID=3155409 RepID=UPI003430E511